VECEGKRLKPEALSVRIKDKNIYEVSALTIEDCQKFFKDYGKNLNERQTLIAHNVIKENRRKYEGKKLLAV
jgi:excinuclease ABC subunit A